MPKSSGGLSGPFDRGFRSAFCAPFVAAAGSGGGGSDAYAIGGASPELVAAFLTQADGTTEGEYFRTGGVEDDFSMFTFSRSGTATMFDSTGTLVWAPHNFAVYSEDFTQSGTWALISGSGSVTGDTTTSPIGSADTIPSTRAQIRQALTVSHPCKLGYLVKSITGGTVVLGNDITSPGSRFTYNLDTQAFTSIGADITNQSATLISDGWYLVTFDAPDVANIGFRDMTNDFYAAAVFVYRSDLGGMADNPDQPAGLEKYVPTTSAAVYLPRRNAYYYDSGWTKGGLQLERAAATNLFENSNSFTSITNGTGTQDATGPDGTTSAWTVVDNDDDSSGATWNNNSVTVATETAYTASIFAKADQSDWIALAAIGFTTPSNSEAYFDLANGIIGTVDAGLDDARMEYYGNGWWRCSITFTTDASDTSGVIRYFISPSDNSTSLTRDGTNSVLMYGKQFEEGPIATSYIPTSGSTVTRAAETLSIAAADLPYSATAMSISIKGLMTYADNGTAMGGGGDGGEVEFYRWTIDGNDYIRAALGTVTVRIGEVNFAQEVSGTRDVVSSATDAYSPGYNVPFSIAARHGSTFINGAVDGTALTVDETPTALPDLSTTDLLLCPTFNGFISEFRMWDADIGDDGIEEVTTP